MAGKIIPSQTATIGAATATGYLTLPSVTGYYKGAKAWISKVGQPSQRIVITEVLATGNQLGVRFIDENTANPVGGPCDYGRDDVSAYATTGRIDMEDQFVYSANDTGLS